MKIVNIIGGLGNQMFQYAFALSLQEKFPNEQILIDTSHYHYIFLKKWKTSNLHNGYEIDKLFPNASIPKAKALQLMKVTWYMPNYWLSRIIRKILPKRKTEYIQTPFNDTTFDEVAYKQEGDCYYEGYWQAISYYLPIINRIQEVFKHPKPDKINAQYINKISTENSVGIHIRRGDYLNFAAYKDICNLEYYKKGISEILKDGEKHIFYIFSNDLKWCKENICPLLGENPFVMVTENTGEKSCWDMFLMTYCKDLIIANSSFSWWGAFLNNRQGRIIASKKWNNNKSNLDFWGSDWIKL